MSLPAAALAAAAFFLDAAVSLGTPSRPLLTAGPVGPGGPWLPWAGKIGPDPTGGACCCCC